MEGKIDSNYGNTAKAVTDDGNQSIANLLVDPISGRLEIDVLIANSFNDVTAIQLKEDSNYGPVSKAVTDDANQDVRLLKVDSNGRLIIDLAIE